MNEVSFSFFTPPPGLVSSLQSILCLGYRFMPWQRSMFMTPNYVLYIHIVPTQLIAIVDKLVVRTLMEVDMPTDSLD